MAQLEKKIIGYFNNYIENGTLFKLSDRVTVNGVDSVGTQYTYTGQITAFKNVGKKVMVEIYNDACDSWWENIQDLELHEDQSPYNPK